ncbi:MAG TPA: HEPN domain-containing protein [Thiotrichaceae bacterium]|nr:HEPN domain-containing protein [Thiotrichaceae bacterium]
MPTSLPTPQELKKLAKSRLQESEILFSNHKYDAAVYLCGYAIELALKARICKTLKWSEFPNPSVKNPQTFKTHHLITLLALSGITHKVKSTCLAEWTVVTQGIAWDPELRYQKVGSYTRIDAANMINAVKTLLKIL